MRTTWLFHWRRLNCRPAWLAVLALLAGGCTSRPTTVGLEGDVTFDGRAIESGNLELSPTDGTPGASAGATIANGHYAIPSRYGVLPNGVYLVRVTAMRKTGRTEPNRSLEGGPPMPVLENYIPPIYNSGSTLKIKVAELADKNAVNFQLGRSSPGPSR